MKKFIIGLSAIIIIGIAVFGMQLSASGLSGWDIRLYLSKIVYVIAFLSSLICYIWFNIRKRKYLNYIKSNNQNKEDNNR